MKKYILTLVLVFAVCFQVYTQIQQKAQPVSFSKNLRQEVPFVSISPEPQQNIVSSKNERQPLFAGYKVNIEENALDKGVWTETRSGIRVWRIGFTLEGSKGLNVYFKNVTLQKGDNLFIYNQSENTLLGAFTYFNNGKFLATGFVPGDKLIVELNTYQESEAVPFEIGELGVSVLPLTFVERGFGSADFCEVLVNCPEGEDWKSERNGVARILVSESKALYWCSGTLVNNTNQDQTPYFLTANHCGRDADSADYMQWVFYFNYESRDCEFPDNEPPYQTISGAHLISSSHTSTNSGSDFKLLLLADEVPKEYEPFYNGWDRSGSGGASGVGIHHPEGDLKMVSTYTSPLVSTNYNDPTPDTEGKYWKVEWTETENGHGVTEGGSSGSPIFSQGGYVVGLLSGGRASCSMQDAPDYYGKFSYSWESNGTDSTWQLKPWLDPKNLNVERLPGFSLDSNLFAANFTASATEVKVGGRVTFFNQSQGDIIAYEWYFEGGDPAQSETEIPPKIAYSEVGEYDVMLIAKSLKSSDTLLIKDYIHVLPSLTPNPSSGHFSINFGDEMPQNLDISVTDIQGQPANFTASQGFGNSVVINLSQLSSGIYIINVNADGNKETLKAMLIKNSEFD